MMKRAFLHTVFPLLAVLIFSQQSTAGIHEDLVSEYIRISGLEEVISTFPDQIDAMGAQRLLTSRTPEQEKMLTEMMKQSFDIETATKDLNTFLVKNTTVPFLKELLHWLESPLAQKIKEEELSSSDAAQQADMMRYMADLQTHPPPRQRIALIQELEQTLHLSDLTTIIVIEMIRGMIGAVNLALPEEDRQPEEETAREMNSLAPMLKESFREQMIMSSFFTYRNISDKEIQQYLLFYKSKTGQKEIEVTGKALSNVLKQWFISVGQKLIQPTQPEKQMT